MYQDYRVQCVHLIHRTMTRPEDKKMGVILIHHARGVVLTKRGRVFSDKTKIQHLSHCNKINYQYHFKEKS